MCVVAIIGVLAAIGITLVRGHVYVARTSSAMAGAKWILAGQNAARAERGQFQSCSVTTPTSAGSTPAFDPKYYPMQTPGRQTYAWGQPDHPHYACYASLGLPRDGGTQFGYLVNAGLPASAPNYPPLQTATKPTLPAVAQDPWYIIQFKGDLDGDGKFMKGVATSLTPEVHVENEGE